MKKLLCLIVCLLIIEANHAQIPVGSWRDHFSFGQPVSVAAGNERVFIASANGVFWYKPADATIGKITKVNGLSDVGISSIEYSPNENLLLVGYQNGNIDLVYGNSIVNIPFIKEKLMMGSKRINHFFLDQNQRVYVSTGFGIVVLNLQKNEVLDTYFIGENGTELWVNQVALWGERIYAATANGLYSAMANDPLLIHFASWAVDLNIPNYEFELTSMAVFNDNLILSQVQPDQQADVVFYNDTFFWQELTRNFGQVKNLWSDNKLLLICSRVGIGVYETLQSSPAIYTEYADYVGFSPNKAIIDSRGNITVADNWFGLMYQTPQRWIQAAPNGPLNNNAYFILPTDNDLLVAGGSRSSAWGNLFNPFTFHTFSQQQWSTTFNNNYFDAVRIARSPLAENEYFIATWGFGVVVYRDGAPTEWYNPDNSSLETITPGAYCRIGGLTFDKSGNLWLTNAGVTNPISVRLSDGTWKGFPYESQIGSSRISDITLDPWGQLWVVIPSGGGLFVLNPGDNPTSTSSHTFRKFFLSESDGTPLSNDIHSLAFDRDGYLWVGTSQGVIVSYNPDKVFQPASFRAQRLKIPDVVPGLAVYLLESESVTTIAVDGANRKWFGTSRSGVFLQSADGVRQLKNFTMDNSPLPSNSIQHIAIHPKSGEVFIATDKGLISYRGDATDPAGTFEKVYAFPNPVRPDYDGLITITGLVDKTIVKITDVAGNLVYETRSLGGQATWDGKNKQGKRVTTGVYLYFCSDSQGEQSAVGKILFVR